jgi:hypothetical protein
MAAAPGAKAVFKVRDLPRGGARRGEMTIMACDPHASVPDVISQACAPKVRRACCAALLDRSTVCVCVARVRG